MTTTRVQTSNSEVHTGLYCGQNAPAEGAVRVLGLGPAKGSWTYKAKSALILIHTESSKPPTERANPDFTMLLMSQQRGEPEAALVEVTNSGLSLCTMCAVCAHLRWRRCTLFLHHGRFSNAHLPTDPDMDPLLTLTAPCFASPGTEPHTPTSGRSKPHSKRFQGHHDRHVSLSERGCQTSPQFSRARRTLV